MRNTRGIPVREPLVKGLKKKQAAIERMIKKKEIIIQ